MKQEYVSPLVLGIGSRLMGDDSVGVRVVEALGKDYEMTALELKNEVRYVRFKAGETDVEYCMRELDDCDICIIIDAACTGKEPGTVDVIDLKEIFAKKRRFLAVHEFDLFHAMKWEGKIKEGILIAIEAASVSFSADLSPVMQERFPEILREVKMIIGSYLLDHGISIR